MNHDPVSLYTVDAPNVGRRLDGYVRRLCADVPLATLMKWIRVGAVRLNGKRAKALSRLQEGDEIRIPAVGVPQSVTERPRVRLPAPEILYEDADLLIANKPAFLACHAGTGHADDSLAARVEQYLDTYDAPPGHRPGLAQRLDRGVSGVVPLGKHAAALRALALQVQAGAADKTYIAFVDGVLGDDAGEITIPLRVDDEPMGNRPRVFPDPVNGKPAHTRFQVTARWRDVTRVEVRILTGRTHQIRAHLRAIGHAILGDPRYGDPGRNDRLFQTYGLDRPCLHAARLVLSHPMHDAVVRCEAPLPPDMQRLMRAFGNAKPSR